MKMLLSIQEEIDYQRLLAQLDQEVIRLSQRHASCLQCRPKCTQCCMRFSVLPIEAAVLQDAVTEVSKEMKAVIQQQAAMSDDVNCPLLVDNLCSVYKARPIICRTHGIPLAYINEEIEAIEVSACPNNFKPGKNFIQDDLLFMDQFNSELASLNSAFCLPRGLPPHIRIAICEIPFKMSI